MLRALLFAAVLAAAAPAAAQPAADPSAPIDRFLGAIQAGDVEKALKDLGRGTLMEKKQAELNTVAEQAKVALNTYGRMLDWELMSEEIHSPSFRERLYLVRMEQGPVFYRFHLYRGPNGWIVSTFFFTDVWKNAK